MNEDDESCCYSGRISDNTTTYIMVAILVYFLLLILIRELLRFSLILLLLGYIRHYMCLQLFQIVSRESEEFFVLIEYHLYINSLAAFSPPAYLRSCRIAVQFGS